jgi:membrane-associated phospholipid phosphatase
MFPFERLAIVFFALFGIASLLTTPGRRPLVAILSAGAAVVGIVGTARTASVTVRLWLPHLYLVVGYWLPALLVGALSSSAFESWLVRTDAFFRRILPPLPHWVTHIAELSYLMCYPAVPAAFIVIWTRGSVVDAERFWTSVLAAGFVCYGNLPWLPSRPPRLLNHFGTPKTSSALDGVATRAGAPHMLAVINTALLARVSHQLNTFPSGHVAVSVAAATCALIAWWPAGVALAAVAGGIAVGAVAGRYHYVIDVLLGVVVGLFAVAIFARF